MSQSQTLSLGSHHANSLMEEASEIKRAPPLYLKMCAFPRMAVFCISALECLLEMSCYLSTCETPEQFRPHFNQEIPRALYRGLWNICVLFSKYYLFLYYYYYYYYYYVSPKFIAVELVFKSKGPNRPTLIIHHSAKNFVTIRHELSISAICIIIYRIDQGED